MFTTFTTNLLPLLSFVLWAGSNGLLVAANSTTTSSSSICDVAGCVCNIVANNFVNVTCNFSDSNFVVHANSLPSHLYEFGIIGGVVGTFENGAFSKLLHLRKLVVCNVTSLSLQKFSFLNLSRPLRLEFVNVESLLVDGASFHLLRGPVAVFIADCRQLTIRTNAIPWIEQLSVENVQNFRLEENAFSQTVEKVANLHQRRESKISMTRVNVEELPKNSFPSSAIEIRLVDCIVKIVRKDAFSPIENDYTRIENSVFDIVETEAFSERSLFRNLHFTNLTVYRFCTCAVFSAVTNFTVSDSTMHVVESETFNMPTTLYVSFVNNYLVDVRPKGIVIRGWTTIHFSNNTFRQLSVDAVYVPCDDEFVKIRKNFHFVGNVLETMTNRSLNFDVDNPAIFEVDDNIFLRYCQCDRRSFLDDSVRASEPLLAALYDRAYCRVDKTLAECLRSTEGFVRIANYTDIICGFRPTIDCLQRDANDRTVAVDNPNIVKAVDVLNERMVDHRRKTIEAVVIFAVIAITLVVLVTICAWTVRKVRVADECRQFGSISGLIACLVSALRPSSDMRHAMSSNSITRVSVHEYDEPRKLWEGDEFPYSAADANAIYYSCENKATQTLPEELTQELLATLRDKLDDPDNYKEARCMIEHLYDIIKVEECCNNNILEEEEDKEEEEYRSKYDRLQGDENIYDCVRSTAAGTRQRLRRYDKTLKTTAHKGTRAPSPDKLLPLSYTSATTGRTLLQIVGTTTTTTNTIEPTTVTGDAAVVEYSEPSDRRSYSYIYSELLNATPPSDNCPAAVVTDYKDPRDTILPIYAEVVDCTIRRPLPRIPSQIASTRI